MGGARVDEGCGVRSEVRGGSYSEGQVRGCGRVRGVRSEGVEV